jgi:hypothetical protein
MPEGIHEIERLLAGGGSEKEGDKARGAEHVLESAQLVIGGGRLAGDEQHGRVLEAGIEQILQR